MADLLAALVDGAPATALPLTDGGFAYGDGLFETLLYRDGRAALLDFHVRRLVHGLERLGLPVVDPALLVAESAALVAGRGDVVVKWMVTRGDGGRGYRRPAPVRARRLVLAHAATALPETLYRDGVTLGECTTGYAAPSPMAGLKHLNRLEQVIARSGLVDPSHYDGVMFDPDSRVVSATSANLFVRFADTVVTPRLERCGVAGVCRAALLASAGFGPVVERDLDRDALAAADEVILSSAVRGVLPVRRLGARDLRVGPMSRAAQSALAAIGFAPLVEPAEAA